MTLTERLECIPEFLEQARVHPLEAQLIRAMVARTDAALQCTRDQSRFLPILNEIVELMGWLSDDEPPPSETELALSFQQNQNAGWTVEHSIQYLDLQRKRRRGRPRSKRRLALFALEERQLEGLSWMKLANKFCPCSLRPHDERCRERLRHQVKQLQEMLARLGV